MTLTAAQLENLLAEWPSSWGGARCVSAGHADARRFILAFEPPAGNAFALVVDLTLGRPLLYAASAVPVAAPSPLGGFLKRRPLEAWETVPGDRIARLRIGGRTLIAELIPASPRLILLEGERIVWIDAPLEGKKRRLVIGETYATPDLPEVRNPRSGVQGPKSNVQRPETGVPDVETLDLGRRTSDPSAVGPLNGFLAVESGHADRTARREALLRALRSARAKAERGLAELAKGEAAAAEADLWRIRGDLLKAALGKIRPGQTEITLTNWYDPSGGGIAIPLDPAKSARENMELCFKRHRKWTEGGPARERRRRELESRRETAAALLARAEGLPAGEDPGPIESEARAAGCLAASPRRPGAAAKEREARRSEPHRRFVSTDGLDILVGKSDRENDALSFRVARGNDLWLHVDGAGGSHVVVRLSAGKPVPPETLLDAAALAVHFSRARGRARATVVHTFVKHLRRIPGAPPGQVAVTEQRFLTVDLDRRRLDRLFQKE